MEKADIVWEGKACGVVQALSLADGGRICALAVNEDPDDVTTRSYVSAGRVSNKSQAFYLAGLSTTTHGAQFAFSRFGIRSEAPQENLHFGGAPTIVEGSRWWRLLTHGLPDFGVLVERLILSDLR